MAQLRLVTRLSWVTCRVALLSRLVDRHPDWTINIWQGGPDVSTSSVCIYGTWCSIQQYFGFQCASYLPQPSSWMSRFFRRVIHSQVNPGRGKPTDLSQTGPPLPMLTSFRGPRKVQYPNMISICGEARSRRADLLIKASDWISMPSSVFLRTV